MKPNLNGNESGMKETQTELDKNVCENTGEKKWTKKCPKCGKEQIYSCKKSLILNTRNNSNCRNCATKESGKTKNKLFFYTNEYKEKMSNVTSRRLKEHPVSLETKLKLKEQAILQWKNPDFRKKIKPIMESHEYRKKHQINSKKMWSNESHIDNMKNIHNSEEYRKKRRIITQNILNIKYKDGKLFNYNKIACEFIDKINKIGNYNFQHAENGGEYKIAGYFLDGYDKDKNIVFEYDESHHYDINGILHKSDVDRQNNIIKELRDCNFWRFNERKQLLYDALTNDEIILCQ